MTLKTDSNPTHNQKSNDFHWTPYSDIKSNEETETIPSDPDSIPLWNLEPSDEENQFNKLSDYIPYHWNPKT